MTPLLPATPARLEGPDGPRVGLWSGQPAPDGVEPLPGRGRIRRWSYAAAADDRLAVGAAIVDLGAAGTAFVWLHVDGRVRTWERRLYFGAAQVASEPDADSSIRHRRDKVRVRGDGGLLVALDDVDGLPVHLDLRGQPSTPVTCATPTPAGGFNVTVKEAGHRVLGQVAVGDELHDFDGHGWRDWTVGRQDRRTAWRWAAGGGRAVDGRAVGLNASTGMNASGPGEDVAWVAGQPVPLQVDVLAPQVQGAFDGPWVVRGAGGLDLRFTPRGVRSARENLLVIRSAYTQPIGVFSGTVPGPDGRTVEVQDLPGVTEDHEALW